VQSLQILHSAKDRRKFTKLEEQIDLILFDEGHREPSLTWAKAIRDLGKPVVLFTATPYRNDDRRFNVARAFTYQFWYDTARQENIIRDVEVKQYPSHTSLAKFATLVLELFDDQHSLSQDARVLVRCSSVNELSQVVAALNRERPGIAMGFHTTLPDSGFLRRKIPDWQSVRNSVSVFVHEKLLLEGFDDNRLTALAVFGAMSNARELIQQVGRVIRNRTRQPETAVC
jgi:superfamily II DNA or RNA helicase